MDLHFTADEPTRRRRRPSIGCLAALSPNGDRRQYLLPVLHAIQDRKGWISPGALNYACRRLKVPPAEAFGVADFYALFQTRPHPPVTVHVCDDIACRTRGAEELCAEVEAMLGPAGESRDGHATWHRSPCLGLCERAPAALVVAAGEPAARARSGPGRRRATSSPPSLGAAACRSRTSRVSVPQLGSRA